MKVLPDDKVFVTTAGSDEYTFVRSVTTTREKAIALLEADGYKLVGDYWWNNECRYQADIDEFEVQS